MYKIQTLNKISQTGLGRFPKDKYQISNDPGAVDAILVRSANLHELTFEPSLKAIARAGAGTDNIPITKCSESGIVVFNTPGANANAVCELVLFGLLASSRLVIKGIEWAKSLIDRGTRVTELVEKGKNQFIGPELRGKTLGIIGLGAIGSKVADVAIDLGMRVIGFDPFISVDGAWKVNVQVEKAESINALVSGSDYISLHIPETHDTENLFDATLFEKTKAGARLLNFSRAGLVVEADLFKALDSGKIAAYVTDFPNQNLLQHDKCLCIPHLGASTPEAEDNCAIMAVDQLVDYLENGNIVNSINFPNTKLMRSGSCRICIIAYKAANIIADLSTKLSGIAAIKAQSRDDLSYIIIDLKEKIDLDQLRNVSGVLSMRILA